MKELAIAHQNNFLQSEKTHAAKYLGLSVTTVHKIVEQKTLNAWYTDGNHRQVSMETTNNYLIARKIPPDYLPSLNSQRKITIIMDENNSEIMYTPSFGHRRINL
jgi:excisionase family DNA binding protein